MMSMKRKIAPLLVSIVFSFFPVNWVLADAVTELNVLATDAAFPRVSRAYTTMDARFERRNFLRSVAQVDQVKIGTTKAELVAVVGQPISAYSDGSWNFNLSFRLPQSNRIVCQYRVFFDDLDHVAGTIWRRPQCADIMNDVGR